MRGIVSNDSNCEAMRVLYGIGGVLIGLITIAGLIGTPSKDTEEYRAEVKEVYKEGALLEVYQMEAPFKQEVKKDVIEAVILKDQGGIIEVKDTQEGVVYRVSETHILEDSSPRRGDSSQKDSSSLREDSSQKASIGDKRRVRVKKKEAREIFVRGIYSKGSSITFRTNIKKAPIVGYKEINGESHPIYNLEVPKVEVSETENKVDRIILVSGGKAYTISKCGNLFFVMPDGTHTKDGLFQVRKSVHKFTLVSDNGFYLEPLTPSAMEDAKCWVEDGYTFTNVKHILHQFPIFNESPYTRNNSTYFLCFLILLLLMVIILTPIILWY